MYIWSFLKLFTEYTNNSTVYLWHYLWGELSRCPVEVTWTAVGSTGPRHCKISVGQSAVDFALLRQVYTLLMSSFVQYPLKISLWHPAPILEWATILREHLCIKRIVTLIVIRGEWSTQYRQWHLTEIPNNTAKSVFTRRCNSEYCVGQS